ncbi:hypothetical protein XENTR_v10018282 [Xenopus tropicalis]|nr:hypothetical protein XENTR_v10018282 [Xenopus tropicalis]
MLCSSMSARKPTNTYEDTPEYLFVIGLLPTIMLVPQAQRPAMQVELLKNIVRFIPQANQGMSVSHPPHPYTMVPPTPANPWYPYQYPSTSHPSTSQAWDNAQNSTFTDL